MKKLVTIAIAAIAGQLFADSKNANRALKRMLMFALATLGLTFVTQAACPEGYTDLGGTYSFAVDDAHATSGKWYINGEFRPVDGATIDGAEWYVDNLIAFQADGQVLNLKSGTLTWTATGWGGGVYPNNNTKWLNFMPGSTLVCINPNISVSGDNGVFEKCFRDGESNFHYNNERITDETRFNELFTVEAGPSGGSMFYLTPIDADTPVFEAVVATAAEGGKIAVSASFVQAGSPAATVYAAWATSDLGRDMSNWSDTLTELGTASTVSGLNGFLSNVPDKTIVYVRLFAVSGEKGSVSNPIQLYSRYYGVPGVVNEFLGTVDTSLSTAGNWLLGHVPTDSEIRWFETATVEVSGNFTPRATDEFRGGSFIVGNEFQPVDGCHFAGTDFTMTRIAPQHSPAAFTAVAGNFVITSNNNSFWNDGQSSRYCEISVGSTAVFTFPMSKSDFVNNYLSKFRHGGASITSSEFNDQSVWTVVEDNDGEDNITTTFYLTPAAEGAPELGDVSATVDSDSATVVTINAVLAKVGASQPTSFIVNYGFASDAMSESIAFAHAGDYVDGTAVSVQLPNLVAKRLYYYQVVAVNDADRASSDVGTFVTFNPGATDCVWIGGTSSKASVASNWSTGVAPTATTDVQIYDVYSKNSTIEWDVPVVASWHQESFANGSVEVVFETTTNSAVTITGNATILSGSWTHKGPAAEPVNCLNVQVGGDFTLAAGAKIETKRTGYHLAGPGKSVNYGTLEDGEETRQLWTGGAYAGDAGHPTYTGSFVSYGSILNPIDWGSAGKGDGDQKGYSGAGLIILNVAGALAVNGNIEANGFGYNLNDFAGSSGGTINITAGTIAGNGKITANGGNCNCGPGGGGRIRVALTDANATFASFGAPDHIVANSGTLELNSTMTTKRDTMIGAAGTITLVSGGETKVIVADTCTTRREPTTETLVSATHLPARQNADSLSALKRTKWELSGHGAIRLTRDVQIASLSLSAEDGAQKVYTDGFKLTTPALVVNGSRFRSGTYTAETNPEFIVGDGSVTVGGSGLAVFVR